MKKFKVIYSENSFIFGMSIPLYKEEIIKAKNEKEIKNKIENKSNLVFSYKVVDIKEIL